MNGVDSLRARFAKEEEQRRAANHAALAGAVLASKANTSSPASSLINVRNPTSGASAAATKTWRAKQAVAPPQPPTKPISLSAASTGAVKAHKKSQENLLKHRERDFVSRTSSPSHTAASIAAASQKQQALTSPSASSLRPVSQYNPTVSRNADQQDGERDTLPEPGTVKDVRKWLQALERSDGDGLAPDVESNRRYSEAPSASDASADVPSERPRPQPLGGLEATQISPPPVILSPQPVRAVSAAGSIDAIARRDAAQATSSHRPPPVPRKDERLRSTSITRESSLEQSPELPARDSFYTPPESVQNTTGTSLNRTPSKPAAPPPRRSRPQTATDPESTVVPPIKPPCPTTIDPEPRQILPFQAHTDSTASIQNPLTSSFAPRLSVDETSTSSSPLLQHSQSPAPSLPHHRASLDIPSSRLPYRRVSPSLSTSNLATAIVASSLASSRTASPTKPSSPAPSLPPRPGNPQISKPMRRTMRSPSTSSDSSGGTKGRKGYNKLLKKHPHKHHEGTKKRWRDAVTDAERKRYEGVWAGNRGLLLPRRVECIDFVHGFVVRDLWARSRLPVQVLEEVWGLVVGGGREGQGAGGDGEKCGEFGACLSRTEFVVGMWLIDQRLKGRKLPVKVGGSVWESARWSSGVKVPVYK